MLLLRWPWTEIKKIPDRLRLSLRLCYLLLLIHLLDLAWLLLAVDMRRRENCLLGRLTGHKLAGLLTLPDRVIALEGLLEVVVHDETGVHNFLIFNLCN